jgi:DNA (cytosine-5)-methyltransferase 1
MSIKKNKFKVVELFAGAGGLALGFEKAGLKSVLLNEIDKDSCDTLRKNRPNWNVIHDDVRNLKLGHLRGEVDVVSGGFPCQAFSYAGKKLGFEDARGTLFFEFARIVNEIRPSICIGENVRGLQNHDSGRTLKGMIDVLDEIGYSVIAPQVLKAVEFQVPQKRERLIIVGVRKDLVSDFQYPKPHKKRYTMRDVVFGGDLFDGPVPESPGMLYPIEKAKILDLVPPGGYWRDLPIEIQKAYMGGSYYLGGGKTGIARRLSLDEPSLTVTCSPAQKQTERCHPLETRPLSTREYARIQTFPDDWQFVGSVSSVYRQIGNAVPVNLGYHLGKSVINALNNLQSSNL